LLVCPEITIANEEEYPEGSGVMWISEFDEEDIGTGSHAITVTFDAPVEGVRLFVVEDSYDWEGGSIIPDDAVEILMTSDDGMIYTGEPSEDNVHGDNDVFDCGSGDSSCDEEWIYVLFGESCCPVICSRIVMIDDFAPFAALVAKAVECPIECDTGIEIVISKLKNEPACEDPEFCCGDDCTEVVAWDLTIYMPDFNPFTTDGCCDPVPSTVCDIFFEDSGLSCDDLGSTTPCIPAEDYEDGDYPVIFHLTDLVGNETTYYGVLTIDDGGTSAVLHNSLMSGTPSCPTWVVDTADEFVGHDCFPTAT
jgi:hypothetical protein